MNMQDQSNMYIVNPINTGMQDWSQTNISIIIPAYNCHNTIIQTLASIAMQENIHEIETIIADDNSGYPYDDIAKIFSNFMKIKIVRLLKGGGPGTARQVGCDYAVGKYIMFMDGDDSLVGCDAINILKKTMLEKDQDCVYGQFLEQSETGDLMVHEIHMVWTFGKLYKKSFLDHYSIRMNMSHSNEDTGYNCLVKGCTSKVWYIPKPVYTWRYKPNSITRFNNGMYGSESGMCGYLTNMIWQIKELEKRFINKNYILDQIISIMCVLYHFFVENSQRYPLNRDANIEWIRYYYEQCYKPYEHLIDDVMLTQTFARVAAEQNVAGKGIIPKVTFFDFMEEIKSKPYTHNKMHDVGGSVIEIPQTTPENYPVEIHDYTNNIMPMPVVNTNTNLSRMDGMQRVLEDDKKQREEFLKNNIIPSTNWPKSGLDGKIKPAISGPNYEECTKSDKSAEKHGPVIVIDNIVTSLFKLTYMEFVTAINEFVSGKAKLNSLVYVAQSNVLGSAAPPVACVYKVDGSITHCGLVTKEHIIKYLLSNNKASTSTTPLFSYVVEDSDDINNLKFCSYNDIKREVEGITSKATSSTSDSSSIEGTITATN